MIILTKIYSLISFIAHKLFVLLELFLFLRLALKFLGANPQTLIVNLIYKYSDFLVSPFALIFPDFHWPKDYLIEAAGVSAVIGYALAAFIIFRTLRLFSRD